jgi:hypothetical protein
LSVTPSPAEGLIIPNAPCSVEIGDDGIFHPIRGGGAIPRVCEFGVRPPRARRRVALVGDSHAETWRAALAAVAGALDWEGASMTRSSCPYLEAVLLGPPAAVASCLRWRRAIVAWLQANPQVETMFVSDHATLGVAPAPGRTAFATAVSGYLAAWRALPPTVRHIVVLRDTPELGHAIGTCVAAAQRRRRPAATACAVPRHRALAADPATVAARRLGRRARAIDLSGFFCDRAACYPVIGGVLVFKDGDHMTRTYSATLGPYVQRALAGLLSPSG